MKGIDCSNHGGEMTEAQARTIKAQGYDFAIVGAQVERFARQQAGALSRAGLRVDFYYYPYYNNYDAERIDIARRLGKEFGSEYLWDDVEWHAPDGPQPSPQTVREGVTWRVGQLMNDFKVGIYTSSTQWPSMTAGLLDQQIDPNVTPLWYAFYYFDRREPDFASFKPFGPWVTPLIWQWHDTTPIAGFSVDLNTWNPAMLPGTVPAPPTDVTLDYVAGRDGLHRVGVYEVLYNAGVPIWRYGGNSPGATAKNFGGRWCWLRSDLSNGLVYWSFEEGD